MNNRQKLKLIMAKYNLTHKQTADLIGVKWRTITAYRRSSNDKSARIMPDKRLNKLIEATKNMKEITI